MAMMADNARLTINEKFLCPFKGACFARGSLGGCRCLVRAPEKQTCPFQKPAEDVTKGKRYEYNPGSCTNSKQDLPVRPLEAWAVEWDFLTGSIRERYKIKEGALR